jgi:hypothetical protein
MECSIKNPKANGTTSVSIFSARVWTNILLCSIPEIIATQNLRSRKKERIKERKKERKKESKLASDYINAMLRIALTISYDKMSEKEKN